jgi:hypothetical protein
MKASRAVWAALVGLSAIVTLAVAAADTAAASIADQIKVTPLVVDEGRVLTSFAAVGAFTDDAQAVMKSGLLLTFTFTVEVRRPSSVWFDATLAREVVSASVKYDNLTSRYQVSKPIDGKVVWSERTELEAQARSWLSEFEKVPLDMSESLEPNGDYYVQVRLHANPRRRFSVWPWGRDDGSGRADFSYIR